MLLTVFVVGTSGPIAAATMFLPAAAAFAITAWVSFYGGADRIWVALVERGVIDV